MKQKNKPTYKIVIIILAIIIFAAHLPLVHARSKPVTGAIEINNHNQPLKVDLTVEINFDPLGKQLCKIEPVITTGSSGSFTSNLENLVMQDFPDVKCNTFWQHSDAIWYETTFDGQKYMSQQQEISLGTGLQKLSTLIIKKESSPVEPAEETNPSPGSGGGGSSPISRNTIPSQPSRIEIPLEQEIKLPKLEIDLKVTQSENRLKPTISLSTEERWKNKVKIVLILFELPNKNIIVQKEYLLKTNSAKSFLEDLEKLKDGRYEYRAFAYIGDELVTVSAPYKFIVNNNFYGSQEEKETSARVEFPAETSENKLIYGVLFGVLLIIILFYLIGKKQNKGTLSEKL
jgi:hypothetical protein